MTGRAETDAAARLAEVLSLRLTPVVARHLARDLLPVVRDLQAEELEAASKAINEQRWNNRNGQGEARDAERIVRDLAAALRGEAGR